MRVLSYKLQGVSIFQACFWQSQLARSRNMVVLCDSPVNSAEITYLLKVIYATLGLNMGEHLNATEIYLKGGGHLAPPDTIYSEITPGYSEWQHNI